MWKYLFVLLVFTTACSSNIKSTAEGDYYVYEPLNWEILIPDGWDVMAEIELKQMEYKAKGYYEEDELKKQYGEKNIIMGLKKPNDETTAIYAFTRSFRPGDDPPRLKDILSQQYRSYSSGVYTSDTSLTIQEIEGIDFEKAVLNVQYNNKPYFSYITYSTQLKDTLSFGVSIILKTTEDSMMLTESFFESVKMLK